MADRPILFSAPMVRALLDGTKTQTRRVLGLETGPHHRFHHFYDKPAGRYQVALWQSGPQGNLIHCVSGPVKHRPGDRLWVREAFSYETLDVDRNGFMPPWYWADGNPSDGDYTRPQPSIHMPRWASRLTLTVTDVRVQRLQDISEADALAEGAYVGKASGRTADNQMAMTLGMWFATARAWYADLWDRINGKGSWASNPWVSATTFTVERRNIDAEVRHDL